MPIASALTINKNHMSCALLCALLLYLPLSISQDRLSDRQGEFETGSSAAIESSPHSKAARLNNQGLQAQKKQQLDIAIGHFLEAAEIAAGADSMEASRYRLNAVRAMLEAGRNKQALAQLAKTSELLNQQSEAATELRLAIADLYRGLVNDLAEPARLRLKALEQLTLAEQNLAGRDPAMLSWIYGYKGALYEDESRHEESLQLTRLAIAEAEQSPNMSPLYRWEWQLARNLANLGETEKAVAAYARAANHLNQQRRVLESKPDSFKQIISPFYYQYADLLLQQSEPADSAERQARLKQVQQLMESVKAAEVIDYFQDQCVVQNSTSLNDVESGSAILYPILLNDRLELIATVKGKLTQVSVPVSRLEILAAVRDFRLNIQVDTATRDYLHLAQKLYTWLIAPIEEILMAQQVKTLVVIPDGPMRTIPFSALHDGDQYLIERYALATAPGLNLVASSLESAQQPVVFAGGLSEAVQGFSPLPSVSGELSNIEQLMSSRVLKDQQFTKDALTEELIVGDYSIVHLATHGQFRGSYADSFLLTYDGRLQIDELGNALVSRQAGHRTLDLLVLSACESAAGDDRAALGLAGVAIKSGASSAVASLWEVDDEATRQLISNFYTNLAAAERTSKAGSLQQAQKKLIAQDEFSHPSNWAPFLIIGEWQ
ncbi:MAG: CHAT domain-containing protein [Candidatus Thiodiazotropha taylori]|nr:CHAT domain-containing protein [Candidatus Thiodiazotropha taylori]